MRNKGAGARAGEIALFSKRSCPKSVAWRRSSAMIATIWHDAGHDVEVITAVPVVAPWSGPLPRHPKLESRALGARSTAPI